MRRREFCSGAIGAMAWPTCGLAQQRDPDIRRVGFLIGLTKDSHEGRDRFDAFGKRLASLGWIIGKSVQIEDRWAAPGDRIEMHAHASELVAMDCEVVVVNGGRALAAIRSVSSKIPVVLVNSVDPENYGSDLRRPTGNTTGLLTSQANLGSMFAKGISLLKEIAPNLKLITSVISRSNPARALYDQSLITAANANGLELKSLMVESAEQLNLSLFLDMRDPDMGLFFAGDVVLDSRADLIVKAMRDVKIPAIYGKRHFVEAGGLMSYGANELEFFRMTANLVDKILKGARTMDLPIQQPSSYELVINMKAALALGLSVPHVLLASADEVVE